MRRRDLLRKHGLVFAATMAPSLAGCTDRGEDDDTPRGSGDDATPASTPTETTSGTTPGTATRTTDPSGSDGDVAREGIGEVEVDSVDGLDVVGWTSRADAEHDLFQVTVTLENVGNQETAITPGSYTVAVNLYDDGGSLLVADSVDVIEQRRLASGETAWVKANADVDDPGQVASYGIRLACEAMSRGVYCG